MMYKEAEGFLECDWPVDGGVCPTKASVRARTLNMLRDEGWYVPWASQDEPAYCPAHAEQGELTLRAIAEQQVREQGLEMPKDPPSTHVDPTSSPITRESLEAQKDAPVRPDPPVAIPPERAVPRDEADQPLPIPTGGPAIQPLVAADIEARMRIGITRYGTPLQPHNGRDMLRDAYDEAMDLVVYLRGMLYERDGQ